MMETRTDIVLKFTEKAFLNCLLTSLKGAELQEIKEIQNKILEMARTGANDDLIGHIVECYLSIGSTAESIKNTDAYILELKNKAVHDKSEDLDPISIGIWTMRVKQYQNSNKWLKNRFKELIGKVQRELKNSTGKTTL